ncbi:MAG TPA: DUF6455 family protein [Burkholderiales bacterium]|nr:DUF6455 family protein [Burkholderiales bacterium]
MTALIISLASLFLFATAIAALPYINAAWRRIAGREADLQIWRVMDRRGIVPDNSPGTRAKLARAVRRCLLCPSIEQCDRWLGANAQDGLEDFCPNATLLEGLRPVRK